MWISSASRVKFQPAILQVLKDALQPFPDLIRLFFGNNTAFPQHSRVSHTALNILPVHPLVKGNGRVKVIYPLIRILLKSSSP